MGVSQAGTRPPAKSYGGKTAAHAQSVPRVCNTSWECGRETLSLSIYDKANERTPEKESGRIGPRYGASQRPQKTGLCPCLPAHSLHPSTTPMEHTMTTMIEGFMTRLNARRDGEPCQEANSEMAEASSLPVGMIHKQ